jgi:[acyl-carrier-protein] S-malonyltransferase
MVNINMSTALLFPGQGSQFVGMGKEHFDAGSQAREMMLQADEILGFSLTEIMFQGPEEKLKQTEFTQPAIFLHSLSVFSGITEKPDMVAGHSLGEFSALVACQATSFEETLKIVRLRGELMQKAGTDHPGTMAAIIGMEDDKVEEICSRATEQSGKEVIAANYNSPGQLVISGYEVAVDKAVELAQDGGCRMARKLPVSGAFHSSLMQSAYDGLKEGLENLSIQKPVCPLYSNYTAEPTTDPEQIRSNLLNQLLNPVRWTQTLQNMQSNGASNFVEVGPGKVLQGLVKRTLKGVEISGYN